MAQRIRPKNTMTRRKCAMNAVVQSVRTIIGEEMGIIMSLKKSYYGPNARARLGTNFILRHGQERHDWHVIDQERELLGFDCEWTSHGARDESDRHFGAHGRWIREGNDFNEGCNDRWSVYRCDSILEPFAERVTDRRGLPLYCRWALNDLDMKHLSME